MYARLVSGLLAAFAAGPLNADGWPTGGFLTVVNNSQYEVVVEVENPVGNARLGTTIASRGTVAPNRMRQFDDVFRNEGMHRVGIVVGLRTVLASSTQISGPHFLKGRRLVITDQLIERGGNIGAEKITAYHGTWRLYNEKQELFLLNIRQSYGSNSIRGALSVTAMDESYPFRGSVDSAGALILDFLQDGRRVGRIQASPDLENKGVLFGQGEIFWIDPQTGAESSRSVPLSFRFVGEGRPQSGEDDLRGVAEVRLAG